MKNFELILEDKKLPFSPAISITEDGEEIFMEADFGEDKELWKKTFFPDVPDKELWKHHKTLQLLYDQLEDKLTKYTKDNFPEYNIDWDMLVYDELLLRDNNFKMAAVIDK